MQVLQRSCERTFSDPAMGFVPGGRLIRQWHGPTAYCPGPPLVVDLDLEKFFDRVNHNKLIGADRKTGERQAAVATDSGCSMRECWRTDS